MGSTQSSESNNENNVTAESQYGFSRQESLQLTCLRRLVCQKPERDFLSSIWRCSHLLAFDSLQTSSSRSSSNVTDIETNLAPSQRKLLDHRCRQLNALQIQFDSLTKMNTPLKNLFQEDDHVFFETISNMIGLHGNHQKDSLEFVCDMLCNEESFSAKDTIDLCYQIASALHFIFQEDAFDDSMKLAEQRNNVIQSITDSLLEYSKSCRKDGYLGSGYDGTGGAGNGGLAANNAEGNVTKREFLEWQRKVVPDLFNCSVAKFLKSLLFPPEFSQSQKQTPWTFPTIRSHKEFTSKRKAGEIIPISSLIFGSNTMSAASSTASISLSPPLFAFASISMPKFGDNWYRIFACAEDGWTFQSLERQIMGYEGPTLLVIQAHSKNENDGTVIFGAYSASKWERNKRDFFGTSDCFLFQLQPTLKVFKPLPKIGTKGGHYMYFNCNANINTANPSRKDDLAQGLGFGGTVRQPRLFVDSYLEKCTLSHQDTSFEKGYLGFPPSNDPFSSQSFSSTVSIDSLEVYAVGNAHTIDRGFASQRQHRDNADATLRNARTVDKAAFLGDMRSGLIESKAFAHRGQVDGRAHGELKGEEEGEGRCSGLLS